LEERTQINWSKLATENYDHICENSVLAADKYICGIYGSVKS